MIYVAHPYDQQEDAGPWFQLTDWLVRIQEHLRSGNIAAFWPTRPYQNPLADSKATYDINELALRRCEGVLAVLPAGVPSVGVPMEILTAHQLGKPVVVLGSVPSLQLAAMGIPVYTIANDAINDLVGKMAAPPLRSVPQGILWTGDPECKPTRGYAGDAGFDLYVAEDTKIHVGGFQDVPHGICVEMPPGYWGLVTGRSSTIRKRGLLVVNGIIDNGYRGPLFAAVQNLGSETVELKRGERVAQLIPFHQASVELDMEAVPELSPGDRGLKAFGSTGN